MPKRHSLGCANAQSLPGSLRTGNGSRKFLRDLCSQRGTSSGTPQAKLSLPKPVNVATLAESANIMHRMLWEEARSLRMAFLMMGGVVGDHDTGEKRGLVHHRPCRGDEAHGACLEAIAEGAAHDLLGEDPEVLALLVGRGRRAIEGELGEGAALCGVPHSAVARTNFSRSAISVDKGALGDG